MNAYLASTIAVAIAYLVGAIPFAYLAVYAAKGIDVRTVGSGNAGATNASRVLGAWSFPPIFLLDVLKGLMPTLYLPRLAEAWSGRSMPDLPVLVGLAAILGHNFPVYLKFHGGKGVATSLGAVGALDPMASGATVAVALVVFLVTKMVSVASAAGATIFVLVHFGAEARPFSRRNLALDVATLILWGMLMVLHRKNFARVAAGTEPRVQFRRRKSPPTGRIRGVILVAIAMTAVAASLLAWAARPRTLDCGSFTMAAVARVSTGHQRAERLAFADKGRRLAVTCPRYNRVVVYKVAEDRSLSVAGDVDVCGRAVAVWPLADRFLVLVRPYGDARHLEPGWLQAIDLDGRPIGAKTRVGYDPDDVVATADGRWAFVVNSGHAEGESNRPNPEFLAIDLADIGSPRVAARLSFDQGGDDPARISLSASGRSAAVSLLGSNRVAAIDVSEPSRPSLVASTAMATTGQAYPTLADDDWMMMPARPERDVVLVTLPGQPGPRDRLRGSFLVTTLPENSGLEVFDAAQRRSLGRLPVRGAGNLGSIRPEGLAYSADRGLIAVANRSGGSVHLVEVRPKAATPPAALARLGR